MPLYHYQAIDSKGKKKSGDIEGKSEREVKHILRSHGVMVTSLTKKSKISSKQNMRKDHLLTFTLQLSQLISSGVPLYESVMTLEEQCRGEKYHRVVLSIGEQIKNGKPLSDAMGQFPQSFDRLYCAMIKAGESSGTLDQVLARLSHYLQKSAKLKRQLITALIYPSVLAVFSLLIIFLLLGFVVPSIEAIFEGRQLNSFTETVLHISHFLQNYWWLYLPAVFLGSVYLYFFFTSLKGNIWLQRQLIKLPVIKHLVMQTSFARFSRTMGTLQASGLTVIDSLRIGQEVIGNIVLEQEIQKIEQQIIEGSSMSEEFKKSKWVPKMVSKMLAIGEDVGNTEKMFNKIADIYEEEVEKSLERVVALAQPVILIFMGTIIGMVMLAILLPLTDVSSFSF